MRMLLVLVGKIVSEQRFVLLFCFTLLGVFFTLGTYLFAPFGDTSMDMLSRVSPELLSGLFGGLFGSLTPLETWMMTLFTHPFVLTLFSVVVISVATRSLAGEVDRGTIDLLLSYPVARWQPVAACVVVLLGALLLQTLVLWLSFRAGLEIGGIEIPESLGSLRWVAANLMALFCAVSGVALFFSATASDYGRALGRGLGFVIVSFLLNLLANLWSRIELLDVLSVFHYYRPQPIVEQGGPMVGDLAVLSLLTLVGWVGALVAFSRRDIATV